jgi:hypothetical protein
MLKRNDLGFRSAGVSPAIFRLASTSHKNAGETPALHFDLWNRQQRLVGWAYVLVESIQ